VSAFLVRPAADDESGALDDVFVQAARSGWSHIFPADRLARLTQPVFAERELSDTAILVAEADGAVVGFASFGPAYGEDDLPPGCTKVYRLFVTPSAWGTGVGSRLLDEATRALATAGFDVAVLWVGRDVTRARTLYERHGWMPDGNERVRAFLGVPFAEVRYRTVIEEATRVRDSRAG
jgi:GNAT superfamily N-acetyltransferase